MSYALRVWAFGKKLGRCKRCRGRIAWVLDDSGVYRPFRPEARPTSQDTDDRGCRFDIYEPDAFHRCPRSS